MSSHHSTQDVAEVTADNMRIAWDVPIPMGDGVVLRADIFMPEAPGRYPTIMSYGPYGKGLAFQTGYKEAWDDMVSVCPEMAEGTTNKYQNWELVDPEKWVPDGYVCIRVDSRGAGRSEGVIDIFSKQEAQDLSDCVEWAAGQRWCDGKVGLSGISYYAMNQWAAAAMQPPHLAAICVWEGAVDYYRDAVRHGGIYSEFISTWFNKQVKSLQHGFGERGPRSAVTGELVSGPETLSDEELDAKRIDPAAAALERPSDGPYYLDRTPDLGKVVVPLLSSGNWGGMGLHPRGNFEGYLGAASSQKWLEVHGNSHYTPFYRPDGVDLQKRFFGHFLKGLDTGWADQPPVQLQIRRPGENFVTRDEREWPLARTRWTKFFLDPDKAALGTVPVKGIVQHYETSGEGLTFSLPSADRELEITGPIAVRLVVSSDTVDADLFLALRLFSPDGEEVLFVGTNDPKVPIGLGWLRASQRKLDPDRSLPHRPFHSHDEIQPLTPSEPVVLDIEILPTCIVVPPGFTLALNVRGRDYDHGIRDAVTTKGPFPMTGVGPFRHVNPVDRPPKVFGGINSLHFEQGREPFILLPVIPAAGG